MDQFNNISPPMFGQNPVHTYSGPFNFGPNMPGGAMSQIFLPMLFHGFSGGNFIQGQWNPQQNMYDQLMGQRQFIESYEAKKTASDRDTQTLAKTLNGLTQLFMEQGQSLSDKQIATNFRTANNIAGWLPTLSMFLGPDTIDNFMGSRGANTALSSHLSATMQHAIDPITGLQGYSGKSTEAVTDEIFERLFGANADPVKIRHMSAGEAGSALREMQNRGLLGKSVGLMSVNEQRKLISGDIDEGLIDRIVARSPEIKEILRSGKQPSSAQIEQVREKITDTYEKLIDPNITLTKEDINNLEGGNDIIRTADADRMKSKLEDMSGAVKALKEIFGFNAPMSELFNGLQALTQNNITSFTPAELENIVRRTQVIAKQTGIGMQGMMLMQQQAAEMAREVGLPSAMSIGIRDDALLFAQSAAETGWVQTGAWGGLTQHQIAMADMKLRTVGAGSEFANRINAMLRLRDTGVLGEQDGTETAALLKAIEDKETTYTYDGKTRRLNMSQVDLLDILSRDSGIPVRTLKSVLGDRFTNQRYGELHGSDGITRKEQGQRIDESIIAPAIGISLINSLREKGLSQDLIDAGIIKSQREFKQIIDRTSSQLIPEIAKLPAEVLTDDAKAITPVGEITKQKIIEEIHKARPDLSKQQIEDVVNKTVSSGRDIKQLGISVSSEIGKAAHADPIRGGTMGGYFTLFNEETLNRTTNVKDRRVQLISDIQSELARIKQVSFAKRLFDAIGNADPDTNIKDIISEAAAGTPANTTSGRAQEELTELVTDAYSLDVSGEDFAKQREEKLKKIHEFITTIDKPETTKKTKPLVAPLPEDVDMPVAPVKEKQAPIRAPLPGDIMPDRQVSVTPTSDGKSHKSDPDIFPKELKVKVSGTLTAKEDGTVELESEGIGIYNQINNNLGNS